VAFRLPYSPESVEDEFSEVPKNSSPVASVVALSNMAGPITPLSSKEVASMPRRILVLFDLAAMMALMMAVCGVALAQGGADVCVSNKGETKVQKGDSICFSDSTSHAVAHNDGQAFASDNSKAKAQNDSIASASDNSQAQANNSSEARAFDNCSAKAQNGEQEICP
jgi:hypothetical protein